MMITTLFLVTLCCTLYSGTHTLNVASAITDQKLTNMEQTLQQLHEQSNNWAIFKHNVDAWSSQLKDVEHKLTLIRRTQEEQQHKLTGMEFIMNHVLSKVVFLSDADVHAPGAHKKDGNVETKLDDHTVAELSVRLNNILRHLEQKKSINKNNNNNNNNVEHELIRKHARTLEHMHTLMKQVAAQQKSNTKNWRQMSNYCQTVNGELSTFTDSSDLLLKRIELLVKRMQINQNNLNICLPEEDGGSGGTMIIEDDNEPLNLDHDDSELDEKPNTVEYLQPAKSNCHEVIEPRVDGIYKFAVPEFNEAERDFNERFCAFATDGAAWTVVQNRGPYLVQENFNRSWDDYRTGFGSLAKDFWFGNEFIRKLVYRDDHILRIELEDHDGKRASMEYGIFRLDSERYNYRLYIDTINGTVPDALEYHNNTDFSTYDRKTDHSDGRRPCAVNFGSGWWFNSCMESNLNGIYRITPTGHKFEGIVWEHWHGDYSLKSARMLIRQRNLNAISTQKGNEEYSYDE